MPQGQIAPSLALQSPPLPASSGLGAWPEIRGPPASALTLPASRGAFSAQNNAGPLKGWAAGDGCSSKHWASFAKQALIPRPGGPRCLGRGQAGGWGLCLAGRGALGTQEQSLQPTELEGTAAGLGSRLGAEICMSQAAPTSAQSTKGSAGLLSGCTLALLGMWQVLEGHLGCRGGPWAARILIGGTLLEVKLNPRIREERTQNPELLACGLELRCVERMGDSYFRPMLG